VVVLPPGERRTREKDLPAGRLEARQTFGIQLGFLEREHDVSTCAIDPAERLMLRQAMPGIEGEISAEFRLLGRGEDLRRDPNRRELLPRRVLLIPGDQRVLDRLAVVCPHLG
jgi:hypothetical protein